jgi:outer membrane protein assembly factor BamB
MRDPWRLPWILGLGLLLLQLRVQADDWPQWRGAQRDGVWRETGIIERFASSRLELRWQAPVGPGYCGPTVADGRVFLMDRVVEPEQRERVLCFDSKTGIPLWTHSYACAYEIDYTAGPRASVTVVDDRAFALGAMGHLHCLDVGTGFVLWKKDLNQDYSISAAGRMPSWGIAAAPLVYGRLVIVQCGGSDGATVVALDVKSGEERWRALEDRAQYSAPILIQQAGQTVCVCWTGDSVAGLDPETGRVFWRFPFAPTRMPIGVATPVVSGDRLFVSSFYDGSLLLRLRSDTQAVEPIWRRRGPDEQHTDALHCMISTPVFLGEYIYGVDSYGELRCLSAATGDRVWEDRTATPRNRWSNIHLVQHGERFWMFNERGELVIGELSPQGFRELSRARLIDPTVEQLRRRDGVCWSHPAYADRHVYARNDKTLVCASLEAK